MSDLSQSLIDAAAEAISKIAKSEFPSSDLDWKPVHWLPESRAAVVAVLETLAAHCDPVPDGEGTTQVLLANVEFRRLASEVREGR